jgi:hypothetical protein
MKLLKILIISLSVAIASPTLLAQSVAVPVNSQGQNAIQTPRNGENKATVESAYGQPLRRVAAVGEPPISKWVYQDFTVYFEHDIVLHSVKHKS